MSTILLARQPICDRNLRTVGYELLYRSNGPGGSSGSGGLSGSATGVDGTLATATVAINTLFEIGLEQLVGRNRAYVNINRDFLVERHFEAFRPESMVLEILETVDPDPQVMEALAFARDQGFTIALDDFVHSAARAPLLEMADIVKVEFTALGRDGMREHARLLQGRDLKLLAEKVEAFEDFEFCRAAGYDLFQGYFFCKPTLVRRKRLPQNQLALLRLMARMYEPDVAIAEIEKVIERDVTLSYMLLKMVNSALHSLPRQIESIQDAVVMLGLNTARRCVALMLMAASGEKPQELLVTALLRARFCELLAEQLPGAQGPKYFTVGLLSVLEALTDTPMAKILKTIPLTEEVRSALIDQSGLSGDALKAIMALESADVPALERCPWDRERVWRCYFDAVRWTTDVQADLEKTGCAAG